MKEFHPFFSHEEGAGQNPDEPDEISVDDVSDQLLEENDSVLRNAGHIPTTPDRISNGEIRDRIRARVNELRKDDLEISEKGHQEIRDFLNTLRIPGADTASEEEIEILWKNLNQNPSLVRDFTLHLIDRKTKNYYSEYPLIPDMKDLLEFADSILSTNVIRPQLIMQGVKNLSEMGFDGERILNVAMSQNEQLSEGTRFLGWLAGMPFMRGATQEIRSYMEDNDIDSLTIEHLAHVFMVIVSRDLNALKERTSKEYIQRYKMDYQALEYSHSEVIQSMQGILDLLFKYFLKD